MSELGHEPPFAAGIRRSDELGAVQTLSRAMRWSGSGQQRLLTIASAGPPCFRKLTSCTPAP